jgi:hypothetical protein
MVRASVILGKVDNNVMVPVTPDANAMVSAPGFALASIIA